MSRKKSRAKNQKKKELRRKKLLDKISHANYHLKNGMHGHHGKKKCEAIKNKSIQELSGKGWHEDKRYILTDKGIENKAPEHRKAALKDSFSGTLRVPLTPKKAQKKAEKYLRKYAKYHEVAPDKNESDKDEK